MVDNYNLIDQPNGGAREILAESEILIDGTRGKTRIKLTTLNITQKITSKKDTSAAKCSQRQIGQSCPSSPP